MPKLRADSPIVVSQVHPNLGVEMWYRRELNKYLKAAYEEAALDLTLAYRDGVDVGIAQDATPTEIDKVLKAWGKRWSRKFDKLSLDLSKRFAGKSQHVTDTMFKAALQKAGFTVKFQTTRKSIQAYKLVLSENVGLIRNLQQDFYNRIQQDVWAAVRAGGDMHSLSVKLQKSYGISRDRAALIARDQNAKAKAVIESTRRQELGITRAIWQHSSAGKEPRPTHVAMNGKTFELNKGIWDSDEQEWIFPGQLINCRCGSKSIIEGFDE